jgi:hypothetical protein
MSRVFMTMETDNLRNLASPLFAKEGARGTSDLAQDEPRRTTSPNPSFVRRGIF